MNRLNRNFSLENSKLDYIDAIRGVAATGIIIHHTPREYLSESVNALLLLGAGGVPLFFILSAYTLYLSFDKRSGNELNPVRNYFIRRFFRIAPLFYILIVYFLWEKNYLGIQVPLSAVLANLSFTFGLHPSYISAIVPNGWTIGTEMLFYVIMPLIFMWVRNIRDALYFLIFTIIASKIICYSVAHFMPFYISSEITNGTDWINFMYMYLPAQIPVFAVGVLLFFIIKLLNKEVKVPANINSLGLPLLILCAMFFIDNGLDEFSTDGLIPDFVINALIVFVPFILSLHLMRVKILVNRLTLYLGKISYSLYLTHAIVIHWITKIVPPFVLGKGLLNFTFFFLLIFVLTILLASMTYYLIEKPGMDFGRYLISKLNKKDKSYYLINKS